MPVGLVSYLHYSVFTSRSSFVRASCRLDGKYHVEVRIHSRTGHTAFMKAFSESCF
jgi:hypothetical protein